MTVAELIEKLKEMPQDVEVFTENDEWACLDKIYGCFETIEGLVVIDNTPSS